MGGILLDGYCGLVGVGRLGAREVNLPVGGASEDVSAAEGGEGDGIDGRGVGSESIDQAGGMREGRCHGEGEGRLRGDAMAVGMVK